MNILLVEDDEFKLKRIRDFIISNFSSVNLTEAASVGSAKTAIKKTKVDLILMDMSLPSFDVNSDESGGRPHTFGGKELMAYMKYKNIYIPVIVITQFEKFKSEEGELDLKNLNKNFKKEYSGIYVATIAFSHLNDVWMDDLGSHIKRSLV